MNNLLIISCKWYKNTVKIIICIYLIKLQFLYKNNKQKMMTITHTKLYVKLTFHKSKTEKCNFFFFT